jgi:hypothetical protein
MNLANKKSNNLGHLSKVIMLEAGVLTDEEDKNLQSYLSGGENVILKQDSQIYPREWNYPQEVKLAFGQAGVSLMVLTTGRVHICEGADHYWGCRTILKDLFRTTSFSLEPEKQHRVNDYVRELRMDSGWVGCMILPSLISNQTIVFAHLPMLV